MISLLLLFLTILISGIFERIGAIALELTGLPEEQAEFQALSAFSGVGFTTKEAEFALGHPQRRKIIAALINFGSAGVITTLVTLGGTLLSSKSIFETFARDPKHSWMPINFPTLVLIVAILFFYAATKALRHPPIARLVKELVASLLLKTKIVKPLSFQEVLINGNGFGIFQIEISDANPLAQKTVGEADLAEHEIKLLYVNRMSESINSPPPGLRLLAGDIVTVYGPITAVHDRCVDLQEEKKAGGADDPLEVSTHAPGFSLEDQQGKKVALEDFKGKKNLVMVFYPKDKSFFCSAQLKSFSDHRDELEKLDSAVIAVNQESVKSHAGFCAAANLNIPVLSDPSKNVCKAFKTLMFGGLLVDRTVYIIDKKGIIRYAQRGKPALTDVLNVLRRIQELQILPEMSK